MRLSSSRARAWPGRSPAWRAAANAACCRARLWSQWPRAARKPAIAAGINIACSRRPVAAAYPAAACRLGRSASIQAAACPAYTGGALAGGWPGGAGLSGVSEGMCWPAAAAVCR